MEDLLSENNCFWLPYSVEIWHLVEPTDRNARASSRLRSLLLEWTRIILAILADPWVKRERHDWIEGWDKPVTEFQVPDVLISAETTEDSPTSLCFLL